MRVYSIPKATICKGVVLEMENIELMGNGYRLQTDCRRWSRLVFRAFTIQMVFVLYMMSGKNSSSAL